MGEEGMMKEEAHDGRGRMLVKWEASSKARGGFSCKVKFQT